MKKEKKWYQKVSNWLIILACIILVPILIINIYIMIASRTNKNEVPSVFGYKPFIVLSGSMESKIYKGDLVITKDIDATTLKENDIIAFRDVENTVTTHRIISVEVIDGVTYFITKGDNNTSQDLNLVETGDVEGIYVARIPGIGSIMNSLSEPTTLIILVLGITVIFVIGFMISSRKQRELDRKEFLEYKLQKEKEAEEAKKKEASRKPKTTKKNAENDDAIKEVKVKKAPVKKSSTNSKSKKTN